MKKILLSSTEWCRLLDIRIADPDGWRGDKYVTMDSPIAFDDFWNRLEISTVYSSGGGCMHRTEARAKLAQMI